MGSIALFAISGTALVTLLVAKKFDEKRTKPLFIFRWICRGDERIRDYHHKALRLYSEGKERVSFIATKQFKLHSKNTLNKLVTYLKEKREQYENNIRDSRLLKKSDGISEFFRSISDVEKGNGAIDETLEDGSQNLTEKVK